MIREAVDARTVRMDGAAAWAMLGEAAKITVAKGKTVSSFGTKAGREGSDPQAGDGAERQPPRSGLAGRRRICDRFPC